MNVNKKNAPGAPGAGLGGGFPHLVAAPLFPLKGKRPLAGRKSRAILDVMERLSFSQAAAGADAVAPQTAGPAAIRRELRASLVFAALCAAAFLGLLLVRLDFPGRLAGGPPAPPEPAAAPGFARQSWMTVYQQERRIGFAAGRIARRLEGWELEETILLRIRALGLVQPLRLETRAELAPDLALRRFRFEAGSGGLRFRAEGEKEGERLRAVLDSGSGPQAVEMRVPGRTTLSAAILPALAGRPLRPGERFAFDVFDPAALAAIPAEAEVLEREELALPGGPTPAWRLRLSLRGVSQTLWVDDAGELLRARGVLGLRLERASRQEPRERLDALVGEDWAELAAIPAGREIADPTALARLRVRIRGLPPGNLALHGGRQRLEGEVLTVERETLEEPPASLSPTARGALEQAFLRPEPFIQADHPRIREAAAEILRGAEGESELARARRLVRWVYEQIEKRPVLSLPDALATLERRRGDCNEHAVLLTALARAAGIPARVEVGLVYLRGRFYYHAWTLLHAGRWVTADAALGQMPADATHIRLVSGSLAQQADVAAVIGALALEILE